MAYSILDRVYSIFIDIMTGISAGSGSATFYNTDKNTSYIELTVTNGVQSFNMSEYNYILVVNKPDKTSYKNSYSTTDNEKLVIALDSDMLSGIGTNSAQLYIMKSVDSVDKVITMIEFNYIVKPANYKELAPASKDSDSLYISLRNDVDSILSKIENGEIGGGGSGMTATQKEQLATAYNHAMSDAVTTTDIVNSAVATYVEANKDTLKGDKGDTGAKGDKGEKGDTGAKGADGAKGDKGDKGDPFTYSDFTPEQLAALKGAKGDKGDAGAKGANGVTPTLRVGSTSTGNAGTNANVTMTDSNNVYTLNFVIPKGEKGDIGAAGTKGQDGAKGADGITPTLKVGTVTTLAAGSNATVTMSKNNNEYTLNFGIPKGNKGDTGASGSSGEATVVNPTITIGTVTNGDTASATITGDSPNYTLNLVLPKGAKGDKGDTGAAGIDGAKGDKGDKGEKGDTGANGTDGVTPTLSIGTVTTGAAGSSASVTMGGTAPSYVLNFTIPKGDKGDKGDTGASGSGGSSSGGGGIVFEDTYVSDANQWLTNGYTKTSGINTRNLPSVCSATKDKWGILFFIAENATNGTGTQMFFPIDGKYMGKIFTRSITNRTNISSWAMLASENNVIEAVTGTSGAITLSNRMYQIVNATGDIAITLPTLNNDGTYKEIHLFYWATATHTITVASANANDKLLWESIPTVEANAITEFIFKMKDGAWLCMGITYRQQS